MKVWKFDDCTWIFGPDLKSAFDAYKKQQEETWPDTYADDCAEVTPEELKLLEFYTDNCHDSSKSVTFAHRLAEVVDKKEPIGFFATTEF